MKQGIYIIQRELLRYAKELAGQEAIDDIYPGIENLENEA
jgi:hypothetical protein